MNMLPMALGTCRDSGRSLIFLDSGKLWAFATFSTSFFPVRKHQGQRDPWQESECVRRGFPHPCTYG